VDLLIEGAASAHAYALIGMFTHNLESKAGGGDDHQLQVIICIQGIPIAGYARLARCHPPYRKCTQMNRFCD
jgi:hypothetical protein